MTASGTGVLTTVGHAIRTRRKERSQTMGGLARELAIGTDDLSAIEHDETPLSAKMIETLARTLDLDAQRLRARATLLTSARALRPPTLPAAPAAVEARFCDDRRARTSRGRRDIELIATEMRRTLPVAPRGKISALQLFERLDEVTLTDTEHRKYRLAYAVRRLPYRVEARTRANVATQTIEVAVSPEAYRDMNRGNPRTLFTLCHELGHAVLHRAELVTPDETPSAQDLPSYASTEWQAYAFAGAFISPLEEVLELHDEIGSLSPVDMRRQFGCSNAAAQYRLSCVEKLLPGRIVKFESQMLFPFRRPEDEAGPGVFSP